MLIRQQAADLIVGLSETRRKMIRRVLAQGVKQGWTDTTIRARIAQVVGLDERRARAVENYRDGMLKQGVPPGRAEKQTQAYAKRLLKQRVKQIANEEVRTSLMRAQRLVWREMQDTGDLSPYAVRITRVHPDERLCTICRLENGRRRSLWEDYGTGPPFHVKCRCDEEVVDRGDPAGETVLMTNGSDGF